MSTMTIEVPDGERSTMIDALAREALLDLGRLREQLGELITRANPGESLLADCVGTSRLVSEDLAAFRRIATSEPVPA